MTRIAFLTPPLIKPAEPGLSGAAAAEWFRSRGVEALSVDASLGWYRHALAAPSLEAALHRAEGEGRASAMFHQTVRHGAGPVSPLKRWETYRDRRIYSSATNHLANALRLVTAGYPGYQLRVADLEVEGYRPQRSADLEAVAARPSPFDGYFREELFPLLEREGITHAALSFTFLNQAFPGFRLAYLLKEHLPSVRRLAGGPLMACWSSVGGSMDGGPFSLFDQICPTIHESEMESLLLELGGTAQEQRSVLAPSLAATPWADYLVPQPTVPAALARGCYWRRCTFCPDHLHPAQRSGSRDELSEWLQSVARRFPEGAMLHLTDSALSPALLHHVASVIREHRLPLRWHGFARMEKGFADPDFMGHLAEGGCAMLQWGLETASPRLLDLMNKGVTTGQARQVLRSSAQAGIKNHAYLLFGLPTETEEDREQTLAFVRSEADSLHDLNASLLNLPKGSPMHECPDRYGITSFSSFGRETDLSLYSDFRCGDSHPRLEARRWLGARLLKDPVVKGILGDLNAPFKENHACFLPLIPSRVHR